MYKIFSVLVLAFLLVACDPIKLGGCDNCNTMSATNKRVILAFFATITGITVYFGNSAIFYLGEFVAVL